MLLQLMKTAFVFCFMHFILQFFIWGSLISAAVYFREVEDWIIKNKLFLIAVEIALILFTALCSWEIVKVYG